MLPLSFSGHTEIPPVLAFLLVVGALCVRLSYILKCVDEELSQGGMIPKQSCGRRLRKVTLEGINCTEREGLGGGGGCSLWKVAVMG